MVHCRQSHGPGELVRGDRAQHSKFRSSIFRNFGIKTCSCARKLAATTVAVAAEAITAPAAEAAGVITTPAASATVVLVAAAAVAAAVVAAVADVNVHAASLFWCRTPELRSCRHGDHHSLLGGVANAAGG